MLLESTGDLSDLESFPTRRSSDLSAPGRVADAHRRRAGRPAGRPPGAPARVPRRPGPLDRRSEEHTSELQSRGHLVCRLLLEKKKYKYLVGFIANDHLNRNSNRLK